jgi:hypothetical protein
MLQSRCSLTSHLDKNLFVFPGYLILLADIYEPGLLPRFLLSLIDLRDLCISIFVPRRVSQYRFLGHSTHRTRLLFATERVMILCDHRQTQDGHIITSVIDVRNCLSSDSADLFI